MPSDWSLCSNEHLQGFRELGERTLCLATLGSCGRHIEIRMLMLSHTDFPAHCTSVDITGWDKTAMLHSLSCALEKPPESLEFTKSYAA